MQVARSLILRYPQRTALCVTLLATQAFCYNAVFFTYGLILKRFYGVPDQEIGWYLLPSRWATWPGRCCWGGCSTASVGG